MPQPFRLSRRATVLALPALLLGRAALAAEPETVNGVVIGKDGWLFAGFDARRAVNPAMSQQVMPVVQGVLQALKAKGIETTLALIPPRSRVYADALPAGAEQSATVQARYAALVREYTAAGALVPDLAAAMAQARQRDPATLLYLKGDSHWTGEGAAVAAAECARQMTARFKPAPSAKPGVTLGKPVETDQPYDLVRLLPPPRRGAYPDQTYFVRQPAPAAGLLAEDDAADVAVVGNSYMQPRYGFANELSAALNRPVSLTWEVNTVGPYGTLLKWMRSEGFRRQRPKYLVWTMLELDAELLPDRQDIWGQAAIKPAALLAEVNRLLG